MEPIADPQSQLALLRFSLQSIQTTRYGRPKPVQAVYRPSSRLSPCLLPGTEHFRRNEDDFSTLGHVTMD